MQFSRPHVVGAETFNNGGFAVYDAVFTSLKANGAVAINQALIMCNSAQVSAAAEIGYEVSTTTTATDGQVVGRAEVSAASGQVFLVQCYGVGELISGGAFAVGDALGTHTAAGKVENGSVASANAAHGSFAVALVAASGADETPLCLIRCM